MKKTTLAAAFALIIAALSFTACNNTGSGNNVMTGGKNYADTQMLYGGIMPAADAEGYLYTLRLEYDDDDPNEGDYLLVETALVADSVSPLHLRDGIASLTEGDFRVETKSDPGNTPVKYLRLIPDAKESIGAASSATLYFLVNDNNTLTMVNSDLAPAENDSLNYTLYPKN